VFLLLGLLISTLWVSNDMLATYREVARYMSVLFLIVLNIVVKEKQDRITSLMRMIGVGELAYWISWTVLWCVLSVVSAGIYAFSASLCNTTFLRAVDPFVLFFVVWVYTVSTCSIASFTSTYVCQPKWINFFGYLVFGVMISNSTTFLTMNQVDCQNGGQLIVPNASNFLEGTTLVKFFVFLAPWLSFFRTWTVIGTKVGAGLPGFKMSDLYDNPTVGCDGCESSVKTYESAGEALGFMMGAVAFYLVMGWYVSQVIGGEMRQSVFFPLLPSYWTGVQKVDVQDGDTVAQTQELSRKERSVRLHKLSKSYKGQTALKEVSMTMEAGSIVAVLGHNGAGKTTMVNTLCGFHNPTHGHAFFQGRSIREEMRMIQRDIGYCPQQDLLWEHLTAAEHMQVYLQLKGAPTQGLEQRALDLLGECDLAREAHIQAGRFSGGMKRRLSVAVAATGNPSVIFLDEPTTGMDPLHRRQVWRLIQRLKQGRIMVLTTHLMEEADALADSIAILSAGKLRAWGGGLYLKNKYGGGYHVTLQSADGVEDTAVEDFVKEHLPGSKVVSSSAGNIGVSISSDRRFMVPRFFRKIEESQGLVKGWGLSNTTLEEVFLKLCKSEEVNAGGVQEVDPGMGELLKARCDVQALDKEKDQGNPLLLAHPEHGRSTEQEARSWPQQQIFSSLEVVSRQLRALLFPGSTQQEESDVSIIPLDAAGAEDETEMVLKAKEADGIGRVRTDKLVGRSELRSTLWSQVKALCWKEIWVQLRARKLLVFRIVLSLIAILFTALGNLLANGGGRLAPGHDNGAVTFFYLICTMFSVTSMAQVAKEKSGRLYFMLQLQGMRMIPFWVAHYLAFYMTIVPVAACFLIFGYAFQAPQYTYANPLLFVLVILIMCHSIAALSMFLTATLRNPTLVSAAGILLTTSLGIVVTSTGAAFATWKHAWFLIPPIAQARSVQLLMSYGNEVISDYNKNTIFSSNPIAPEASSIHAEFAATLWIPAVFCTFGLAPLGLFLHAIVPNEFGVSELRWGPWDRLVAWAYSKAVGQVVEEQPLTPDDPERGRSLVVKSAASPTDEQQEPLPVDPAAEVQNMTYTYLNGKRAVDGLQMSAYGGECFGLLGPNGAGKSTALNVISGLMRPSSGKAFVAGFNCETETSKVHVNLGVCPQFDAVWESLTVAEHIKMYAMLKGAPAHQMKGLVQSLAEAVELDGDAFHQYAGKLSGGMRRRLSIAISLVGAPPVVLLDEPSTGLDPDARRQMWKIIEKERTQGRCLLLTTHSMEEADTLSTRVGIMSRGRLRALGAPLYLKQKYGGGFRLSFIMASNEAEVPEELLRRLSPAGVELAYAFGKSRTYLLAQQDLALSAVFEVLDSARGRLGIREWGLSQATLDEVFVRVAGEHMAL